MRTSKAVLVWFGTHCLSLGLKSDADLIDWVFKMSPRLRAA